MIVLIILGAITSLILYNFIFIEIEESLIDKSQYEAFLVTPKILKDISNMNSFGCWSCAILIRIFNPIWTIVGFIYYIFHI